METITVKGAKFNLWKNGTEKEMQSAKEELIGFNRAERERAGKGWRTIYRYRIRKRTLPGYGKIYSIYTN